MGIPSGADGHLVVEESHEIIVRLRGAIFGKRDPRPDPPRRTGLRASGISLDRIQL